MTPLLSHMQICHRGRCRLCAQVSACNRPLRHQGGVSGGALCEHPSGADSNQGHLCCPGGSGGHQGKRGNPYSDVEFLCDFSLLSATRTSSASTPASMRASSLLCVKTWTHWMSPRPGRSPLHNLQSSMYSSFTPS